MYIIAVKNNTDKELDNYPVVLEITTLQGFWENINDNGDNIRFTDDNGNQLYFWVEKIDKTKPYAKIWIKIPKIPSSSTINIYMETIANSNIGYHDPYNVFMLFEDFRDGKTHVSWEKTPTIKQDGNYYVADLKVGNTQALVHDFAETIDASSIGIEARCYVKHVSKGQYGPRFAIVFEDNNKNGYKIWNEIGSANHSYYHLDRIDNGTSTMLKSDGSNIQYNTWYDDNYLDIVPSTVSGKVEGSTELSANDTKYRSFNKLIITTGNSGNEVYVTNIIVRPKADPEPSVSIEPIGVVGIEIYTYNDVPIAIYTYNELPITVTTSQTRSTTRISGWIILLILLLLLLAILLLGGERK